LFELIQIIEDRASYFFNLQNLLESGSFLINLFLMVKYDFFPEVAFDTENRNLLAGVAIGLMWYRMFTWMRIYEPTAYFLRLLKMTLLDVRSFTLMMFVVITAFANILYILNTKRIANDEEPIYESQFGDSFASAWVSEFLVGVGYYNFTNFAGEYTGTIWTIWLAGVSLIQIVFLNMLIAIMSDTYAKTNEMR